jgi:predicted RNA-binding Zn-ribbon protein involved in translation (DUF1610 family)
MVLIPCPDCGRQVSTRAAACPSCGCPPYPEDAALPAAVLDARPGAVVPAHVTQALAPAPPASPPAPASVGGIPVMRVHTAAASLLNCPRCGSEHVRSLSLVYREGLAVVNTGTAGAAVGAASGRVAVGGAKTAGTQQSLASIGAAPPEKRSAGGGFGIMAFGLFLLLVGMEAGAAALLLGLAAIAAGAVWVYAASQYNGNVFPGLHRRWESSYSCSRCAEVFVWSGPGA